MNNTFVYYGGSGILAYPTGQPIPLYSESDNFVRYNGRWGNLKSYSLNGQLTGCTYASILTAKNKLEQIYSKDFQPFLIVETGKILVDNKYNIVRDIDFQQSNYVGILNYTINIDCYPQTLWSGTYGVLEPVDQWEYNETDDRTIELTHTISARGFNTSSGLANSFENAKNFVIARTGTTNYIAPYFISYCTGADLCLFDGPNESINRFENTYQITEKYRVDPYNNNNIRYSTEYTCDINKGVSVLNINGDVKSCRGANLASIRNKYNSFDVLSAAGKAYNDACGRNDLNPTPVSSGIIENPFTRQVSFQITFDNNWQPKVSFDYETVIKIDESDITTVGIQGTIKGRGDLQTKWTDIENYYNNQLNLFYLASKSYNTFYNNSPVYPLNNTQLSYSVTKNRFVGEISVSTEYDNKDILPPEFKDLNYTIVFDPQIEKIVSHPLVNLGGSSNCSGYYYTADLGYTNRAALSIRGQTIGSCTGNATSTLTAIKNLANYQLLNYAPTTKIILDKNSITNSNNNQGLNYTFDFKWSMEADYDATVSPFSFIDTLYLKTPPAAIIIDNDNYYLPDGVSRYLRPGGGYYIRP